MSQTLQNIQNSLVSGTICSSMSEMILYYGTNRSTYRIVLKIVGYF